MLESGSLSSTAGLAVAKKELRYLQHPSPVAANMPQLQTAALSTSKGAARATNRDCSDTLRGHLDTHNDHPSK